METLKAGCFLINTETKSVALVYRAKQNDYSFPKGHKEDGETLELCYGYLLVMLRKRYLIQA